MLRLIDPASSRLHTGSTLATFLVPLICIVLAFSVSAWFLFGLLYFIVGTRVTTSIWSSAILKAAHNSESAFCLLFYGSKINCYDLRSHAEYEWELIQKKGQQ
jgi:multisubunit Na+/H+ antiporter MnhG subunit